MTVADITLAVFTFFNTLRFLAYIPQIAKAMRDQAGAQAISLGTWGLFLVSHLSAMAYALENQGDWSMATLFLSNALGCGLIILIAAVKRVHYKRQIVPAWGMAGDDHCFGNLPGFSAEASDCQRAERTASRGPVKEAVTGPLH